MTVTRDRIPIDLGENDRLVWAHLQEPGLFEVLGQKVKLDVDALVEIIHRWDPDDTDVPVQLGHGLGNIFKADGFVDCLELRESGLWARLDLGFRAATMVHAGHRYASIIIAVDAVDDFGTLLNPQLVGVYLGPAPREPEPPEAAQN